MADGADSGITEQPHLGNEIIANVTYGDTFPSAPVAVAPIFSGIRMNNADGDALDPVRIQAPIQGPQANFGLSLHAFWFDRNNDARVAAMDVWDDHEGRCSDAWPLPNELNLVLYNATITIAGPAAPSGWANLAGMGRNANTRGMLDLIQAVQPNVLTGYANGTYCAPSYWNPVGGYAGAFGGYVQYELDEIGEPAAPGVVNSAAVAFHLQEVRAGTNIVGVADAWTSHFSLDLGKH